MEILIWVIFGALVGWIASLLMGTPSGLLWDIVVGIVGAMIGGFIAGIMGFGGVSGFNPYSFIVAILGACVLIFIVRFIRRA